MSDLTGQVWAAARAPLWEEKTTPSGDSCFERRVVYCHTSQMQFASQVNPKNLCTLFGGEASWSRCRKCGENWGFARLYATKIPAPTLHGCATRDLRFDGARKECRECDQRCECLEVALTRTSKVRLVVLDE